MRFGRQQNETWADAARRHARTAQRVRDDAAGPISQRDLDRLEDALERYTASGEPDRDAALRALYDARIPVDGVD